jgi:hypothetical protein
VFSWNVCFYTEIYTSGAKFWVESIQSSVLFYLRILKDYLTLGSIVVFCY